MSRRWRVCACQKCLKRKGDEYVAMRRPFRFRNGKWKCNRCDRIVRAVPA